MSLFGRIKNWFNRISDPLYDIEDWDNGESDWEEVVYNRDDLKISDRKSRDAYIRGCLDQIAEASREVDALQLEYEDVTSHLKDMEEIEALPPEEMEIVVSYAKKIKELKRQQEAYTGRTTHMSDDKYRQMERMEDELEEGLKKLGETEDYRKLIKKDLKRLENEKQAYYMRKDDLGRIVEDCKSMAIICTVAVVVCVLILMILQFGFGFNTKVGYLAAVLAGAIGITMIFIRNIDSRNELKSVTNGISRIIQLQNTVKIRFVNNTNLLDYLCIKYHVSSAEELREDYNDYIEEKKEREIFDRAEAALGDCERAFIHELKRYQVKDPMIWLHQTEAILDKREMVEIRHGLIIQRQSLRRRIDYNREVVAANAHKEIKDIVEKYPKYASEILAIVSEYEEDYK